MEWTKKRIAVAAVGGLFVIGAIGSATDDSQDAASSGASAPVARTEAVDAAAPASAAASTSSTAGSSTPAPTPTLTLDLPTDRTVYSGRATVSGRVRAGAGGSAGGVRVEVDGKTAPVSGGRWSKTVSVERGENAFDVVASKPGYEGDEGTVSLTRKRSQAEIAAAIARRQAAAAQRKQSYLNAAQTIPYNQLKKNADAHAGERVRFTGQIFQVQEDGDSTVILLSVTDEGYGFWTDNIWVDYPGTIKGAEDDVITVYGTIAGSKSYETQIGGETYVPQMTAKYVVE